MKNILFHHNNGWRRRIKAGTALALALTMLAAPANTQEAVTLGDYVYVPPRTQQAEGSQAVVRVQGLALAEGDEQAGAPLSGVTLGVYVQNAQGEMKPWANPLAPTQPLRVVTGSEADTALNLPTGKFYLRVEAVPEGYLMPEDGYYPIAAGERMDILCVQPSQIVVEVSDLAGGVYADTGVLLTDAQGVVRRASTDENGVALFDGLTAGTYTVTEEALPEGALPLSEAAVTITLSQAQRARATFAHPQKGRIRVALLGSGVDEAGAGFERPMADVAVTVADEAGETLARLFTDASGVAEIPLDAGVYRLHIDAPEGDFKDFTLPLTDASAQVSNGMTTPVELTACQNGGRIAITLTGADGDFTGAQLSLTDEAGKRHGPYRAEADGRIVTPLLAAGAYAVQIDALPEATRADDVLSTAEGEIPLATGTIAVSDGQCTQATLVLRAVREQAFTVVGVVPGEAEQTPLAGAQVELMDGAGEAIACTLDETGSATLALTAGTYTVRVKDAAGFEGQTGTLTAGAAAQTVSISSRLARVEITCVDGDHARLAGAQLRVRDAEGDEYALTADETGRALSPLLSPGEATLETLAAPEGYVAAPALTLTLTGGETTQAQAEFVQKGSVCVDVRGTELSDAGQTISRALPGVTLDIMRVREDGTQEETGVTLTTDEVGRAIASLDAGTYLISVRAQDVEARYDAQAAAALVQITDGHQTQAQVTAPSREGGVRVTLSDALTGDQLVQMGFCLIDAQGERTALTFAQDGFMALSLPAGTYTLRHEAVCAGYSLLEDRTVEVAGGALTEAALTLEEYATLSIDRRGVTFDENMYNYVLPISGLYGVYVLTDGEYVPYTHQDGAAQIVANDPGAQGVLSLPAAMEGTTYYLREIESDLAPGYATDTQYIEVTLHAGETARVQLAATADKGFFSVQNLDANTGAALTGAEFALYSLVEGQVQPRSVLDFSLTEEAYRNPMALPVGTYRLVMEKAPEGYALDARMAATQVDFEIAPYLSQGGTVTQVTMTCAPRPVEGEGTAVSAAFEEADGRLTLRISGALTQEMSAPVSGVHVTAHVEAPEGVSADVEQVRVGRVTGGAQDARYGARVAYALRDGGWQLADLREVTGLEKGAALLDLSDAPGVVTDVAVCYFDADTGLEVLGAQVRTEDVTLHLAVAGAQAAQLEASAEASLTACALDERGGEAPAVHTQRTAQAQCTYTSTGEEQQAYSAGVDGVIAGVVFEDENGDGLLGAQEGRRAGVTVELLARDAQGNDSVYDAVTTDEQGAYRFADLPMGVYTVQVSLPAGAMFTAAGAGEAYLSSAITDTAFGHTDEISVDPQHTSHLAHAGIFRVASVAGRITQLTQDEAAQGLSGVYVSLRSADSERDGAIAAVTDEEGRFLFERLAPGEYTLHFDVPEGYALTSLGEAFDPAGKDAQGAEASLTLEMGACVTGMDILLERVGSVQGEIFIDADYDGLRAPTEESLAGADVALLAVDGQTLVAETKTGADGAYRFDGVRAGTYCVRVTLPEEYVFTRAGGDSQVAGAVGASGLTQAFTLARGEEKRAINAGATIPAALRVEVWQDTSYDGLRAGTEGGLAGVEITLVRLEDGEGGERMTLITDEEGVASFEAVSPGNYRVEYVMPGVWRATRRGTDGRGSQVNASTLSTGESDPFALLMGETDAVLSIGAIASVSLAGTAFADGDDNGLLDAGEPGVEGVRVELLSMPEAEVLYTTTTDAQGAYAFEGIAPGRYRVRFTAAQGSVFSGTELTREKGNAPYSETNESTTLTLTLNAGDALAQINAGVVTPGAVSGTFFVDRNDDGVQGADEGGLAGVTVTLCTHTGRSAGVQAVTDEAGAFRLEGIRPGTYTLRVSLPEAYVFSGTLSSSIVFAEHTARSSLTQAFTLASGEAMDGLAFGTMTQGVIAGTVFNDKNFDGMASEGEGGVRGAVVELLRADADPQVVTTGAGGTFRFEALGPGEYTLRVTLPDGMVYTCAGESLMARSDERTQESETIVLAMGESREGLRIGALTPAALGGCAWLDADNDGRRAGEEAPLEGVEVTLYRHNGTDYEAVETVVTGADGRYAFAQVMPGDYALGAQLQAGYAFARKVSGSSRVSCMPMTDAQSARSEGMSLTAGSTQESCDIGVVRVGTIEGSVYLDADYDGARDAAEAGVAGARVELLWQDGTPVSATASGQDGTYRLEGVRVGTYKLRFTLPDDKVFTCAAEGALIAQTDDISAESAAFAFAMGEERTGCDAGAIDTARIDGQIFTDNDFSGTLTAGEGGVRSAAVELLYADSVVATAKTGADGAFAFTRLRPGTYSVRVALPGECVFTDDAQLNLTADVAAQAEEAQGTVVSGALAVQGVTDAISLAMGEAQTLAFPAIHTGAVSGRAFEDQDVSGLYDEGEAALAGTRVELLCRQGDALDAVAETTVGEDGTYRFVYVWPGTYAVRFTLPEGYLFTDPVEGADPTRNSDAYAAQGRCAATGEFTLQPGQQAEHADVGAIRPARLGDTVFMDENGNGWLDFGEAQPEGVHIALYRVAADGTRSLEAELTSDAYGFYRFDSLRPGSYVLCATLPEGCAFAQANVGGFAEIDSDIITVNEAGEGETAVLTLASGEVRLNCDIGLIPAP